MDSTLQRLRAVCAATARLLYLRQRGPYVQIASSHKKWLHSDQIQCFPNFPSPLSIRFSSASQSPNACESAL